MTRAELAAQLADLLIASDAELAERVGQPESDGCDLRENWCDSAVWHAEQAGMSEDDIRAAWDDAWQKHYDAVCNRTYGR